MGDNDMTRKFFAAEFWPDSGQNNTQCKCDKQFGGVSDDRGERGDAKNKRQAARCLGDNSDDLGNNYGDDYYDTDGNATLIKSERIVYNSEEMQFIAVTTKDGHVFYVLINYSAENAEDQVFFLNNVRNTYGHYKLLE